MRVRAVVGGCPVLMFRTVLRLLAIILVAVFALSARALRMIERRRSRFVVDFAVTQLAQDHLSRGDPVACQKDQGNERAPAHQTP